MKRFVLVGGFDYDFNSLEDPQLPSFVLDRKVSRAASAARVALRTPSS